MHQGSTHFLGAMMGAMLILAAPAFLLCVGVTVLAYRRRGAETDAKN
jgi:hypothetical protein